ncbi:MAG: hypothetical protein MK207_00005, partial [Saprospiraceae bacterium]|nr:hypothetical protein [Saprospiraceae bacterium]
MNFHTKQISYWPLLFNIDIIIVLLVTSYYKWVDDPFESKVLIGICILLGLLFVIFYGLFIEVNKTQIQIKFGLGFIKKNIKIKDIESVASVRNKWWYGWGIRLTPHGWLWNIHGLNAVEIKY